MLPGILSTALLMAPGADPALEPWASKAQPGDRSRSHVENIATGAHKYVVAHGGTMDGTNCRSPMGCGMNREGAIEQSWQSNRAVRMENVGQTDVVDPWLSNRRNNFRDIKEMVATAVTPGMSDGEKARALWYQQIQHRYHSSAGGEDLGDPVKVFNIYGLNPCGKDAMMMGGLWKQVGLKGAPVRLVGHAIAQVYYDGGWHVMDGDLDMIYLLRDNETLASDQQLARDHDLVKRTHTMGILVDDSRARDERAAAMFVSEAPIRGSRACKEDTTMRMTLRPGEALVWRWGHLKPARYMSPNQFLYPDNVCNGLWEYRPDFGGEVWKNGAMKAENVASGPEGLVAGDGKTGTVVWKISSPYAFVGGRLETEGSGARFAVSSDGTRWTDIVGSNFDKFFPLEGDPYYQYQLRCELPAGAKLKRLAVINDLQMALLALPEMTVGENSFTYTDNASGERKVRITHEWVERSTNKPPGAPEQHQPDHEREGRQGDRVHAHRPAGGAGVRRVEPLDHGPDPSDRAPEPEGRWVRLHRRQQAEGGGGRRVPVRGPGGGQEGPELHGRRGAAGRVVGPAHQFGRRPDPVLPRPEGGFPGPEGQAPGGPDGEGVLGQGPAGHPGGRHPRPDHYGRPEAAPGQHAGAAPRQ
jgi:hypothetical protein